MTSHTGAPREDETTVSGLGTWFEGGVIEITVGVENFKTCLVHEKLLCNSSSFFDAALKKDWPEGRSRTISLPEEDPRVVYAYIYWVCTGELPDFDYAYGREILHLARSYALEERLLDENFQNEIVNRLLASMYRDQAGHGRKVLPGIDAVNEVYSGTTSASLLRGLLVDLYAAYVDEWYDFSLAPADFLRELVTAMAMAPAELSCSKRDNLRRSIVGVRCKYHRHEDGAACADIAVQNRSGKAAPV